MLRYGNLKQLDETEHPLNNESHTEKKIVLTFKKNMLL